MVREEHAYELQAAAPEFADAVRLGKSFTQTTSDQNYLMAKLSMDNVLNSPAYNEDVFKVSCEWLHDNYNVWKGWVANTPPPPAQYVVVFNYHCFTVVYYIACHVISVVSY